MTGRTGSLHPGAKPVALICSCCGAQTEHETIDMAAKHLGCNASNLQGGLTGKYKFARGHLVVPLGGEPNQRQPRQQHPKENAGQQAGSGTQHPLGHRFSP